jgi:hypothetical protein
MCACVCVCTALTRLFGRCRCAQVAGEAAGADIDICAATRKELASLAEQRKAFADGEAARIAKFEEERIKREKKAKRGAGKGKKK